MADRVIASETVSRLLQIDRGVPSRVVFAIPAHAHPRRRAPEPAQRLERVLHLALGADDADLRLHHVLQLALQRVRVVAALADLERPQRRAGRRLRIGEVDRRPTVLLRELRRVLAGTLAETSRSDSEFHRGGSRR